MKTVPNGKMKSGAARTAAFSFDWPLAYEAESLLRQRMDSFLQRNRAANLLARRMRDETGNDFFEWMDHLALAPEDEKPLRDLGFVTDTVEAPPGEIVLQHPRATLPRVLVRKAAGRNPAAVALRPEFVADFAAAHSLTGPVEGDPFGNLRRVLVSEEDGARLEAVERNGYAGFLAASLSAAALKKIIRARDLLRRRPRQAATEGAGFAAANSALDEILGNWSERTWPASFFSRRNAVTGRAATAPRRFKNAARTAWASAGATTTTTLFAARVSILLT